MFEDQNYLLSITEFLEGENSEKLLQEALGRVDSERRSKAERMRTGRGKAACLGAGLLLQLAVQEAVKGREVAEHPETVKGREVAGFPAERRLRRYSVSELLDRIPGAIPLRYQYGKNGKPYFREYPFYFNLSHSGDYVFCVLSSGEVGADIQQYQDGDKGRLAERFFSPQEIAALQRRREGKDTLFYQLWTRKEAFGKLTGEGIADAVGINFLPGAEQMVGGRKLAWEEYDEISGYQLAVCRYDMIW